MIFLVEPVSPNFKQAGGTERYTINLFNYLIKLKYNVKLIGCSDNDVTYSYFYPLIINNELNNNSKLNRIIYRFLTSLRLIGIPIPPFLVALLLDIPFLKFNETDIVHVQMMDFLLPFILFRKKCKKICTIHWASIDAIRYKNHFMIAYLYRLIESYCYKNADYILFMNNAVKEYYLNAFKNINIKYMVGETCVDLNIFKPYSKEKKNIINKYYGFEKNEKILMYIGRLEKEKRIDFLLNVILSLNNKVKNIKLIIIGDGRDKKHLFNLTKILKLDNVFFLGQMPQEKIPLLLNCADILLLSSKFEVSPTIVREAIACGVPIVSTDVGDVKKIINNMFTGSIVEYSTNEYVNAILKIFDYDKKEIERNCILSSKRFSIEKVFKKYVDIYEELGYAR